MIVKLVLFIMVNLPLYAETVRYAYTPVKINKDSYLGLVSPAKYAYINYQASVLLKEIHQELTNKFNRNVNLEVGVKFMSRKDFLHEYSAPEWTNAMYTKKEIIVPIENFKKLEWDKIRNTLKHEYLHAITDEISKGNVPAWLDEGLAQLQEGKAPDVLRVAWKKFRHDGKHLQLSKLNAGFTNLNIEEVAPAYALSRKASKILLSSYGGYKSVYKFLRASRTGNVELAFYASFGMKINEFEKILYKNSSL